MINHLLSEFRQRQRVRTEFSVKSVRRECRSKGNQREGEEVDRRIKTLRESVFKLLVFFFFLKRQKLTKSNEKMDTRLGCGSNRR